MSKSNKGRNPKVLLFDIEATNLSANFGYMLCFGYKWLGEKKTKVISITDYASAFSKNCTNDKYLVSDVQKVMEQADMIISWYGEKFDVPFIQTRRALHNLEPIFDRPHLDCWKIARYRLKFTSNRLDTVSRSLPLDEGEVKKEKTPLDSQHWVRGAAGHKPSINYIVKHCRADVEVLEQAYLKIRSFGNYHPNMSVIKNNNCNGCPACGSLELKKTGIYTTPRGYKQGVRCQKCNNPFFLPATAKLPNVA